MIRVVVSLGLVLSLATAACRTADAATPTASTTASRAGPYYSQGRPYWVVENESLRMVTSLSREGAATLLSVAFYNFSDQPITLGPSDVLLIFAGQGKLKAERLTRIEPKTFVERTKTPELIAAGIVSIASFALSFAPGPAARFRTVGSLGNVQMGTLTVTPSAQERVSFATQQAQVANTMVERANARGASVDAMMFRKTTMFPGDTISGAIPYEFGAFQGDDFLVLVRVGDATLRSPARFEEE